MRIPEELINTLPEYITVSGDQETREVMIKYDDEEEWLSPRYSQRIDNHSPDGFNWGYGGSGPSQLALAFLMHFLPVQYATAHYQVFKFTVIAALPKGDFNTTIEFRDIIRQINKSQ